MVWTRTRARTTAVAACLGAVTALSGCAGSTTPAAPASPPTVATASAGSPAPPAASVSRPQDAAATAVVAAVTARLAAMPGVAAAKAAAGLPVTDRAREREVTRAFVTTAADQGVPRRVARRVIRDQIASASNVQRALLDAWASGTVPSPTGPPPDLATDLRPRIDEATADLATALAVAWADGPGPDWSARIAAAQGSALDDLPAGVTAVDLMLALDTLSGLQRAPG